MSLFMQNIWVIKRFMSTNMLSKIASTSNASSSSIWPNAYAANKFNLSANGFLKSFGKDKAYTLTRKKVNNPAFVCCDILGGERGGGAISHDIFFFINLRSGGSYSETGCSFARHFAILSPDVGILQPRSQSSSAISNVTSPVKFVGKIRPGRLALLRSVPSLLWSLG